MVRRIIPYAVFLILFFQGLEGCIGENDAVVPKFPNSILRDGDPLPEPSHAFMEGVYRITKGGGLFGPYAVLKWHGKDLSMFTETQGCYFVLNAAHLDSVIFMEGYWRYSSNNNTGLVSLRISKNKGGKAILNRKEEPIIIEGTYGAQLGLPSTEIILEFERPFSNKVKTSDFYVMAHRSGGRNSDNLPVSENSIEMIKYTRNFGTMGIEIDVRLTKDKVPIIYHDEDINVRSTVKGPLVGPIEDFTLDQISRYIRLIRGEKIPTLEEALTFVVDSTELRAVWLDIKEDPSAVSRVIPLQQYALARAQAKNHPLEIWIGMPTQAVINEFLAYPDYLNVPALCELGFDEVHLTNAKVWSPRWTLGTQVENVRAMHAEGRKVFCWTIDDQVFMKKFIQDGEFDGLLSNYCAATAYYFYMQE